MARLQPMPASHELLAPFDVAIRALRPNWAKPDPEMRKEVLRLGWKVLEEKGSSSQEGIWQKLETKMAERGGVVDPEQSELSRGIFDELPPWKVPPCLCQSMCRSKHILQAGRDVTVCCSDSSAHRGADAGG